MEIKKCSDCKFSRGCIIYTTIRKNNRKGSFIVYMKNEELEAYNNLYANICKLYKKDGVIMNKKLVFISRHEPNNGQIALAKQLGYDGINRIDITFYRNPDVELQRAGILEKRISVVAPSYITNILLNRGFELIEFVNSPVKREKMVFCCKGAYIYKLEQFRIRQEYVECELSIEEQVESSLIINKKREE